MKTGKSLKQLIVMVVALVVLVAMSVSAYAFDNMSNVYVQMKAGTTADSENTDFRFVAAVDSLNYDEVGFIVSQYPSAGIDFDSVTFVSAGTPGVEFARINGHTYLRIRITTVFQSVNAGEDVITAESLGGKYIATCKVKGIGNASFGSTYRVVGYTKSDSAVTYTTEKICSVTAMLNGIAIDPSGEGGNIDFGDISGESTAVSYGNYVLTGTWRNNFRSDNNRTANAVNQISLIELGNEIVYSNAFEVVYNGVTNIDSLVGAPVQVGFDAEGNAVLVEMLGTSVTYSESDFTSTYTTETQVIDGVETEVITSAEISLKNGNPITLDIDKLAINYTYNCFAPSGYIFFATKSLARVGDTDEQITLYDTNADGVYDFYSRKTIGNALEVVAVTDKTVKLKNQYGSVDTTGWFGSYYNTKTKQNDYYAFNYTLADGVEPLKVGDMVNIMLTVDCTSDTFAHSRFPATVTVVSKSERISGTLTKVTYGDFKNDGITGEDVFTDLTFKLDNTDYRWSSTYGRNNDWADGSYGINAGRIAMQAVNYGTEFYGYLDTTGNVVYMARLDDSIGAVGSEQLMVGDTVFSTQWDIQGAFLRNTPSYVNIKNIARALYEIGYRRIEIVYTNPGYPSYAATRNGATSRSTTEACEAYYADLGFNRPIDAALKACHDLGMECYAVYKPYEGGGGATVPTTGTIYGETTDKYYYGDVEGLGGIRGVYDTLLTDGFANGVDYRICRRPDGANDNNDLTIDKITIDYLKDYYYSFGTDGDYERVNTLNLKGASVSAGTYSNTNPHPTYPVTLYVSEDNYTYTKYTGTYNYAYTETSAVMRNTNGQLYINADGSEKTTPTNLIRLTISGLNLDSSIKYVAFSFENVSKLYSTLYSSIHAYSGSQEVTTSFSDYVRNPDTAYMTENAQEYEWGSEGVPGATSTVASVVEQEDGTLAFTMRNGALETDFEIAKRFREYGFEFNWYPYTSAAKNSALFAIARGVDEHAPGSPCEGYEEVRAYWLDTVKEMVAAGFDGVEIRLQSHSTMLDDCYNYGYNTPIVEKYKELYGQAAYDTLMDPSHTVTYQEFKRIMEIRGSFFMEFAADASAYCIANGVEFSINLRDSYGKLSDVGSYSDSDRRYLCDAINTPTHWTMPKILIDWQEAVDLSTYVSFKDYIYYTETAGQSNLKDHATVIKEYAKSQGKEIWIQAYDEQSGERHAFGTEFLNYAVNMGDYDSISIYEIRSMYFWAKTSHEIYEALGAEVR